MKKLVLVRHAKSSWDDPGAADFDRKLNKRGKRDAPFMAEKLAEKGVRADLIISSPAKRARKTAIQMAKGIGYNPEKIQFEDSAYSFSAQDILEVLQKVDDGYDTVVFVGHNHGLTDLAERLTGESLVNVPTAGMAGISCKISSWSALGSGCGELMFFDYPKKHQ